MITESLNKLQVENNTIREDSLYHNSCTFRSNINCIRLILCNGYYDIQDEGIRNKEKMNLCLIRQTIHTQTDGHTDSDTHNMYTHIQTHKLRHTQHVHCIHTYRHTLYIQNTYIHKLITYIHVHVYKLTNINIRTQTYTHTHNYIERHSDWDWG